MYLMKMQHPSFTSHAGAVWRQLFVLALLPWMRKHRVFSDIRLSQAVEALARRKLEVEQDEKGVAERFGDDIQAAAASGTEKTVAAAGAGVQFAANATDTGVQFAANTADAVVNMLPRGVSDSDPNDDLNQERFEA